MSAAKRLRVVVAGPGWGAPDPAPAEVSVAVVLDLLDAACSAGASVPGSLAAVGSAVGGVRGRVLRRVSGALRLGAGWQEAWTEATQEISPTAQTPDAAALEPVAAALQPCWQDGVAPGGTLRAAAALIRRERHAQALEAAGRLGVRLVLPLGLCYLPAFVLVGLVPVLMSLAVTSLG